MNRYTPPSMQPARPGATDALKVPSLGTGKPYKPPVAICVGVNKIVPVGFPK